METAGVTTGMPVEVIVMFQQLQEHLTTQEQQQQCLVQSPLV